MGVKEGGLAHMSFPCASRSRQGFGDISKGSRLSISLIRLSSSPLARLIHEGPISLIRVRAAWAAYLI